MPLIVSRRKGRVELSALNGVLDEMEADVCGTKGRMEEKKKTENVVRAKSEWLKMDGGYCGINKSR